MATVEKRARSSWSQIVVSERAIVEPFQLPSRKRIGGEERRAHLLVAEACGGRVAHGHRGERIVDRLDRVGVPPDQLRHLRRTKPITE